MNNQSYTSYIRVSTQKQGKSGLGLEAQRKAIEDFLTGYGGILIAEYMEVESGKKDQRPELQKAIQHCRMTGAILVIAKLDRLSRDLHFIASLQKANVEFTICDMPAANKFTIHILAAVAEHEREMASQRTKAALAAAKARGQILGNPNNFTETAAARGRILGVIARQDKADAFAREVSLIVKEMNGQRGYRLRKIARELNDRRILTARGKVGNWTATAVRNVLGRIGKTARYSLDII